MVIKYVSKHHSPDDPGGMIKEVLEMGGEFQGPAEDILLSWMLNLGDERDPAESAARLLEAYGHADGPLPEGHCGKIVEMLRQTARYPQERLSGHLRGRRKGPAGRRGR